MGVGNDSNRDHHCVSVSFEDIISVVADEYVNLLGFFGCLSVFDVHLSFHVSHDSEKTCSMESSMELVEQSEVLVSLESVHELFEFSWCPC